MKHVIPSTNRIEPSIFKHHLQVGSRSERSKKLLNFVLNKSRPYQKLSKQILKNEINELEVILTKVYFFIYGT